MRMKQHSKLGVVTIIGAIFLALVLIFLAVVMTRELPEVNGEIVYQREVTPLRINSLSMGQAAIGSESEVKAVYGDNTPAPTASMAKVITALVSLQRNSNLNQVITLDEQDEAFYNNAIAVNGSRLRVVAGEQLTLGQMYEALLMVSANNIADSLVYHLFGSQEKYAEAANMWLFENGLDNTKIGIDASGIDPSTTSTPTDMLKIGQIALRNSDVSRIVANKKATFPLEGEVENTNELLDEGYFGIKTGYTSEAGACLLFATKYENETIIGVLMGQGYNTTFAKARRILTEVQENFARITIEKDTIIGKYNLPWGGEAVVRASKELDGVTWGEGEVNIEISPFQQRPFDQNVGQISFGDQTSVLEVKVTTASANIFWRISHLDQLKW